MGLLPLFKYNILHYRIVNCAMQTQPNISYGKLKTKKMLPTIVLLAFMCGIKHDTQL